jgi:hypothetical protein
MDPFQTDWLFIAFVVLLMAVTWTNRGKGESSRRSSGSIWLGSDFGSGSSYSDTSSGSSYSDTSSGFGCSDSGSSSSSSDSSC